MSTTLAVLRQLLSAEIGDVIYGSCASTTTTSGAAGGTNIIDSALIPLPADYIRTGTGGEPQSFVKVTSGTYSGQTRGASAYTPATGTITTAAFGGQILTAMSWELHRLCHPDLKDDCVAKAVYDAYPYLYTHVDSEAYRFGDWLLDGHFEEWATAATLDYWTASVTTLATETTNVHGGTNSCALKTGAGYVGQSKTNNPDLLFLGGTTPTFYAWVLATTASQVRLAIYDGTTTTYGDYHTGGGGWELLSVTATIADNPTDVAFRVYYANIATTAYVDDGSLVGVPSKYDYDLSGLNLVKGVPNLIYAIDSQDASDPAPRPLAGIRQLYNWRSIGENRIQFTENVGEGTRLRIIGRGYLTKPTSSVSTNVDEPQTYIISAFAAKRLYGLLAQGAPYQSVETYRALAGYWESEARRRCLQYGMKALPITRSS